MTVGGAAWVTTDKAHLTSDAQVLAIGDVERPGLATHALGAGKTAAEFIIAQAKGLAWQPFAKPLIPQKALTITHYVPDETQSTEQNQADRCLSCASCRDCHLCETICPTGAITRHELNPVTQAGYQVGLDVDYEYVSDDNKCIGCGFCADTCPCGIWAMNPF